MKLSPNAGIALFLLGIAWLLILFGAPREAVGGMMSGIAGVMVVLTRLGKSQ